MKTEKEVREITQFISSYAACLLGSGVHTSRVIRNSTRIAESFGLTIHMTTFQKSMIITVSNDDRSQLITEVVETPALPINFEYNSELSSLSWEAYDKHLSISDLWAKFNAVRNKPKMNQWLIVLLVGLANGAFCRLFNGDWVAVGFVILATVAGFSLRLQLHHHNINHFIQFTVSAFVSSFIASLSLFVDTTSDIAIATSVLYLIPGVPLINGVIDILEGHSLTGGSRLIQAFLLIICIAVGLSASLLIFQNNLL